MTDRQKLMQKIRMADFAVIEANLFLDTHKTDRAALAYFNKYRALSKELHEEYAEKYGPLVVQDSKAEVRWDWTDGPWPWEYAANSKTMVKKLFGRTFREITRISFIAEQ